MRLEEDFIDAEVSGFFEGIRPTSDDATPPTYHHLLLEPNEGDNFYYLIGYRLIPGGRAEFRTWPGWIGTATPDGERELLFADEHRTKGITRMLENATHTQEGWVDAKGAWKVHLPVDPMGESEVQFREPMQVLLLAIRHGQKLAGEER